LSLDQLRDEWSREIPCSSASRRWPR
jgi:hypothetical protein